MVWLTEHCTTSIPVTPTLKLYLLPMHVWMHSGAEESKTKTWKSKVGHEKIHKN